MIKKISTAQMSKEDWVKLRSTTIGGSDAAAILGMNPWKSPYALFLEKTNKITPEDISQKEAVRLGTDLEEYVAKRFAEATGKKVRRENYTIFRDDMPFAHANYDRLIVGERAGLECKTTNTLQLSKFKNGDFPANYYCQCVHYLMVSGLDRWYLAVLVLGVDFKVFCIERDEDEIEALRKAEVDFWNLMQTDTPPELDGDISTLDALGKQYADTIPGARVDLTGYASDLIILEACKAQIKDLEAKESAAKARIMAAMGCAEYGDYGSFTISWKKQSRKTFDKKKWESVNGIIPENYMKTSESRVFKFVKEK